MEKTEKIINEFERFIQEYDRDIGFTSYDSEVLKGVLALLKAQEPEAADALEPDSDIGCWYDITHNYTLEQVVSALKLQESAAPLLNIDTWECRKCGHILENQEMLGDNVLFYEQYNYCPNCGRKVKWEWHEN